MSEPHIRKVRPDEIEEVWRVHVASSHDGMVRRGQPAARPPDAPVASDARVALTSDPDGYFCAVEDERIRGMVSALVRGRLWYLSMLFVLPDDQSRGLGRALLERALAYGEARGAEIRFTWATLDPRAQTRYVMAGMAARWPIYSVEGDAAAVARLQVRAMRDARDRELPCDPDVAAKLTAQVFGADRADDLAHWRSDATKGLVVPAGGGRHLDMSAPGRFAALKLLGRETNESIMLFEETVPAGTVPAPPPGPPPRYTPFMMPTL